MKTLLIYKKLQDHDPMKECHWCNLIHCFLNIHMTHFLSCAFLHRWLCCIPEEASSQCRFTTAHLFCCFWETYCGVYLGRFRACSFISTTELSHGCSSSVSSKFCIKKDQITKAKMLKMRWYAINYHKDLSSKVIWTGNIIIGNIISQLLFSFLKQFWEKFQFQTLSQKQIPINSPVFCYVHSLTLINLSIF